MESARVEMSVGGASLNGNHVANGVAVNGGDAASHTNVAEQRRMEIETPLSANGNMEKEILTSVGHLVQQSPNELLNMISTEFYLPMATLVSRSSQECWNDLLQMVEKLAKVPVGAQTTVAGLSQTNDQSKANLDKKDALLYFANKHKATFIKLLVLLQWSKRGEDVRKTIELNYWLVQRRAAFTESTLMIGQMMQDLASSQIPNPDLDTAAEVLALGKVSQMPDLGYLPLSPLSAKGILRVLKRLNSILNLRLALHLEIPEQMRNYRVHDGRVTFSVPGEFEVDLSVMSESVESSLLMVDFRFLFPPATPLPDHFLDEISFVVNAAIEKDGLLGAYNFLHDLTLSYRMSELHRQATELSQGLWAGNLKVDLLRRTLVVQYWLKRPGPRSWLEVGIHSGKTKDGEITMISAKPELRIRWFADGKLATIEHVEIDCLRMTMEEILLQIIALHISSIFDAIYEKFLLSPLYASGELEIEQSTSSNSPTACSLRLQLFKHRFLTARVESISGAMILSPASDRTNRVQADLAKSKNIVEEFVGRVSGLRSVLAEIRVHRAMLNSGWQHLPGLKLNSQEMETLFLQSTVKANFYRQHHWVPGWMLVVTQSGTGDYWWLTRRSDTGTLTPRLTQLLQCRPLHLEGSLSLAYLDGLADYTSGVIVLQTNAEVLSARKIPYRFPAIPRFSENYQLPALRFEPGRGALFSFDATGSCLHREVEFSYHGFDRTAQQTVTIARANFTRAATNLKELAASHLDSLVSIASVSRQVMVRNLSETGTVIIEGLVSKLRHVDNIVACATTVKKSTHHELQSLSLSDITILYNSDSEQQHLLVIHFASAERGLHLEFLPANGNPHQHMAVYVSQMLTRTGQSLSKNLEDVLALLRMTQPLMTYLYSIQPSITSEMQAVSTKVEDEIVNVHVLPRQAASYAVHYFSKLDGFPRDVSDSETPKKLLARLEILPKQRGQKTLWVVRPAIEEFNAYTRPSFTSNPLRKKIQEEIFSKQSADWLPLGEGAAVSSDKPEKLLSKIHHCIVDWLQTAAKATNKTGRQPSIGVNGISSLETSKIPGASTAQQARQTANAKQSGRPNGISNTAQGQRSGQNMANSSKTPNSRKQEVITLD